MSGRLAEHATLLQTQHDIKNIVIGTQPRHLAHTWLHKAGFSFMKSTSDVTRSLTWSGAAAAPEKCKAHIGVGLHISAL